MSSSSDSVATVSLAEQQQQQNRATQFCECGDLLYVHDPMIFSGGHDPSSADHVTNKKIEAAAAAAAALQGRGGKRGGAQWYCKRCNFSRPMLGPTVVHETRNPGAGGGGGGGASSALAQISKYITMDPTLPHELLLCPNPTCPSHPGMTAAAAAAQGSRSAASAAADDVADVVIVRTNYQRQEYAFVCTECQHKWMAK